MYINDPLDPFAPTTSADDIPPSNNFQPTLYLGYGSNLWLSQMRRRCPDSTFIGIGRLPSWRWIINARGYANIVRGVGHEVYGLMYTLSERDERRLDESEGVPYAYEKDEMDVEVDRNGEVRVEKALVYVDFERVEEDRPAEEYVKRINFGVKDAVEMGVPRKYFEKYIRPFIPEQEGDVA